MNMHNERVDDVIASQFPIHFVRHVTITEKFMISGLCTTMLDYASIPFWH